MAKPTMYMIAGPNGAGKSTLYWTRIQPHSSAPFINADIIQRDELKDPSMDASYKAAEMAETRRRDYLAEGKTFVSESTFSHPSKLKLIDDAIEAGFRVVLYHVNVRSPDLSVKRVEKRFSEGGHDVPEDKIRERYKRNPALIREAALRADRAYVYDNSTLNKDPELHVKFKDGYVIQASENVPAWARDLYAKELESYSPTRLNPASASFADAKAMATKIGGEDATIGVADQRAATGYSGKIVGETALHWLQQTESKAFIAHFKSSLNGDIKLKNTYEIKPAKGARSNAVQLQPHSTPIGAKMSVAEHASALKKVGGATVGKIGLPKANTDYSGKIIQFSDTHLVQQVSKNIAIAHDIQKLANGADLLQQAAAGKVQGKVFVIQYGKAAGRASLAVQQPIKDKPATVLAPGPAPQQPTQGVKR